jgi:hypothetical protein
MLLLALIGDMHDIIIIYSLFVFVLQEIKTSATVLP